MDQSNRDPKTPSWVWTIVRLAVVVAIFVFLFKAGHLDPKQLGGVLANPAAFFLGMVLLLVGAAIAVLRWRTLLEVQGIHVPYWDAARLTFIGLFFSTVIPGAVTGDIVKAYYVVRGRTKKAEAIVTILLDRVIGMYTIVAVAIVVIVLGWATTMTGAEEQFRNDSRVRAVAVFVCAVFLAMTAAFVVASSTRLRESSLIRWMLVKAPFKDTTRSLYDAVYLYGRHPKRSFLALLYSLAAQGPLFAGLFVMAKAVETEGISIGGYLFIFPVGLMINALPILPGGLGQGEAGFEWLFGLFRSDRGAEVALLFHIAMFVMAAGIGGCFYLLGKKHLDIRIAEENRHGEAET
jgi:uncharacterized protein (TIRG00374 family)